MLRSTLLSGSTLSLILTQTMSIIVGIKNLFNLSVQCYKHWSLVRYSEFDQEPFSFWASRSMVVVEHIILLFFRKKLAFRSGRQCSRKPVQCPVWCGDPRGRCSVAIIWWRHLVLFGVGGIICEVESYQERLDLI